MYENEFDEQFIPKIAAKVRKISGFAVNYGE